MLGQISQCVVCFAGVLLHHGRAEESQQGVDAFLGLVEHFMLFGQLVPARLVLRQEHLAVRLAALAVPHRHHVNGSDVEMLQRLLVPLQEAVHCVQGGVDLHVLARFRMGEDDSVFVVGAT